MFNTPPLKREPPSEMDQSPLPSKPIKWLSNLTLPVSSPPDAEPNSITVSSPSDTVPSVDKISSSSRTPGDHHGVTKVTSESEPPTNVVSSTLLPTHPHEWYEVLFIKSITT